MQRPAISTLEKLTKFLHCLDAKNLHDGTIMQRLSGMLDQLHGKMMVEFVAPIAKT